LDKFYTTPLEEIVTWQHVRTYGFTADSCGNCKKTVNVICAGPGWICPNCGAFNTQNWSGNAMIPHENPDMGPTRAELQEAYRKRDENKSLDQKG
jgi:RNA polymerase subunit RPABC4/transcription elongation factor Spt4